VQVGNRTFSNATVSADAAGGAGQVTVEAADLAGVARWGASQALGGSQVQLARLNVAEPLDAALGSELLTALGGEVQLTADSLTWRGRLLGRFTAELRSAGSVLEVRGFELNGETDTTRGSGHCREGRCVLELALDSRDAGATLTRFGFRSELEAQRAELRAALDWPQAAEGSLASMSGRLHMQFEDGMVHPPAALASGAGAGPFALLAVPALLRALDAPGRDAPPAALHFSALRADYELHDGEALTANFDFDGDAQILLRGKVGLATRNYDAQAVILKGEERLPAAVRGLAPPPRVAAVLLSLRELIAGSSADRGGGTLRLQGTWDEPMVMPAE
jgi:uncharacterized protein YhdP